MPIACESCRRANIEPGDSTGVRIIRRKGKSDIYLCMHCFQEKGGEAYYRARSDVVDIKVV